MSNKDDKLIYESYLRPSQKETTDDILLETIDHIITALEGHGMLKIISRPDRGAIKSILKRRHAKADSEKERDHDDEKEDFKTRLLRAIAQAGDSDLNMPFEEAGDKKPDGDGDGVPDWADKHHGEDDHEVDKKDDKRKT